MDSNCIQESFRLFHDACNNNILDNIQKFVQNGYPVNSHADLSFGEELFGYTPLHFAVKNRNKDAVTYLLVNGADITRKSANGWTPVHLAYYASLEDLILTIFKYSTINTYVNAADERGLTHFHICCALWDKPVLCSYDRDHDVMNVLKIVKDFIMNGADVNCKTLSLSGLDSGFTPLHFAVKKGADSFNLILKLLLDYGADHSLKCDGGLTPLHLVCELDVLCSGIVILQAGADFMARDDNKRLPLHCMVYRNHKNYLAGFFLEYMPTERNYVDNQGMSVLHMACLCGKLNTVKRLLAQGYCPNSRTIMTDKITLLDGRLCLAGSTPLHMALCQLNNADWKIVQELLSAGADINAEDAKGNTPLGYFYNSITLPHCNKFYTQVDYMTAKHIAVLEAAGLYVSEKIKKEFSIYGMRTSIRKAGDYTPSTCINQLEKMQRVKISNCADESNNLRSILHKNEIEMARLLSNENVKYFFNPYYMNGLEDEFHLYGYMIKAQVNKGLRRIIKTEILSKAKDAFNRLTAFYVPDVCSEIILSHLSYDDLKDLIDAGIVD